MMSIKDFVKYVLDFYGIGGLYDYKFTKEEVEKAIKIRIETNDIPFDADSVDRELVRDIVLDVIRG
jgi:hypothetical protein